MNDFEQSGTRMQVVGSEQTPKLAEVMKKRAQEVERALDVLLPLPEGPEKRLIEAMRYAVLGGGKRLRGFLVMEVASLFSVAPACAARVAASVEMLHAYSLVHDDLPAMDDDDLRRGQPSCAASGARGMVAGQMIDMLSEGEALSGAEVTRLQALKTGRLIQYSAEAGAILGRAPSHQRHLIAAFGRDLGAAFQIADDILDTEGTAEEIGKTAGKDEAAGKATMVSIMGLEQARAHAAMLAEQAAGYLSSFGERAVNLIALTDVVVSRRS
jgi:farnesyl diphosphate synthase